MKFGSSGFTDGKFSSPRAIDVDASGNMYVVDTGNNRIQKFDSNGNFIWKFGSFGIGNGQFSTVQGIALDSSGHFYTVEQFPRVQKFDTDGNYISKFGSSGSGDGQFSRLQGIVLDSSDNIYTVEEGNARIQKFDSSGNFIMKFGSSGSGDGQFQYAREIALDAARNIYIVDQNANRVQKFDSSGNFITKFGSSGSSDGLFSSPSSIELNSSGNIYVVDTGNNRVQKFSQETYPPFNIISNGTSNFSYLSVTHSYNHGGVFDCTNNCIDQGGNTNWMFVLPLGSSGGGVATVVSLPIQSVMPTSTTPISTTTPIIATSTVTITPTVATTTATTTAVTSNPSVITPSLPPTIQTPSTQILPPVVINSVPSIPTQPVQQVTPTVQVVQANNFSTNIIAGITQSYAQAVLITKMALESIRQMVQSPAGSVITKIISTAGIVAGSIVSVVSIAFATPVTFSEIWLIPERIIGLLLESLGLRKKQRAWGTVYDSVTKRPLDPAYVTLIDSLTKKEIATAITDLDGRYSFLVIPGTYILIARKTNYLFPSVKMTGKLFDEVYNDIYLGNEITVLTAGEVITKNIPMDPLSFDWNEFTKNKMNINTFLKAKDVIWARISKAIFMIGGIISFIALISAPQPYNIIIAVFYIIAYILNFVVFKVKKAGSLIDKATHTPLSFAIIKVFREGAMDTPILKKIADKEGKYYALIPKGNYVLQVDKKNDDATYTNIYTSGVAAIETGIINEDLVL